jgi:hypothetical protein
MANSSRLSYYVDYEAVVAVVLNLPLLLFE